MTLRQHIIDSYLEQYVKNNPDEDERSMRKELQCMSDDELFTEYTNYLF